MRPEIGFRVCRMCLQSEPNVSLTSLFEGLGEKAEIFQLLANIDVRNENIDEQNLSFFRYFRFHKMKIASMR